MFITIEISNSNFIPPPKIIFVKKFAGTVYQFSLFNFENNNRHPFSNNNQLIFLIKVKINPCSIGYHSSFRKFGTKLLCLIRKISFTIIDQNITVGCFGIFAG